MAKSGVDTRPLQRAIKRLASVAENSERELQRVLVGAQRVANTEAKRGIVKRYNISQRAIAGEIRVRGSAAKLQLTVEAVGRPRSAANFSGRQVKTGFRFKVLKSAAAITIRRGFSPENVNVPLMRTSKSRYPVAPILGPSSADMLAHPEVSQPVLQTVSDRVETDAQRRTQRAIEQAIS